MYEYIWIRYKYILQYFFLFFFFVFLPFIRIKKLYLENNCEESGEDSQGSTAKMPAFLSFFVLFFYKVFTAYVYTHTHTHAHIYIYLYMCVQLNDKIEKSFVMCFTPQKDLPKPIFSSMESYIDRRKECQKIEIKMKAKWRCLVYAMRYIGCQKITNLKLSIPVLSSISQCRIVTRICCISCLPLNIQDSINEITITLKGPFERWIV